MAGESSGSGVVLAGGRSASEILHGALTEAVRAHGGLPGDFSLPGQSEAFRRTYPEVLPAFEAARLVSTKRNALAMHIVDAFRRALVWQSGNDEMPIAEALKDPAIPVALEVRQTGTSAGWRPELVYAGKTYAADDIAVAGELLGSRQVVTPAAAKALAWVGNHLLDAGRIHLGGRRIAMLGAGAEMAPTRAWLRAGADVLWLDAAPPPAAWFDSNDTGGRLHIPVTPVDLLSRPREVLATLIAFSNGEPLDLGLYAYAPGQAREIRLTAVMNALVEAMPRQLVRSVTLLVSPTTPTALDADDVAAMDNRRRTRPAWEAALSGLGLLSRAHGCTHISEAAVSRSVVGIQGASYQAAQYVGKVLTAQCWYQDGQAAGTLGSGVRISANTAAITRTRSLEHPVFTAAFGGASAFGVETMLPEQSRCLNGLLALHDWFHPDRPVPGRIRVHGGIHSLPYPLEPALRVAAAIGFVRQPKLLRGFFRP